MNIKESILHYKRYLKRKNCAELTIKNYLHRLKSFVSWVAVPIEEASPEEAKMYIDFLLEKGLMPHSINCHLSSVRGFYDYLRDEQGLILENPVIQGLMLREAQPLPRYLRDHDVELFLESITSTRDRAIIMLMLRCGLRVQEVANLTLDVIDYQRSQIVVRHGKGGKDRIVYISDDAATALAEYLRNRLITNEQRIFLVEIGQYKGNPVSVRAIQKRVEYYAKKSGVHVTAHRLRHTMATQLLNANADLVSIQQILGHSKIKTTQRYTKLSNNKAQRDYFQAMEIVMERTTCNQLE